MPNIGSSEIIVLLIVLVLLFGATRLPKAAEGIGKSLKVFKREIRSGSDDDDSQTAQPVQNNQNAATQQNSQAIAGQATESPASATPSATADSVPPTHQQK